MNVGGDNLFAGKVRILSDLHLGHPGSLAGKVSEFRPLLEGVDTVVFNGDTCEMNSAAWVVRGRELLEELKGLCREVGVRPVFLTGNHDPGISGQGWLDLLDGALLVTHGDMVHREVAPWSREYLMRKREVAEVLEDGRGEGDDLRERWEAVHAVEEVLSIKTLPKRENNGWLHLLTAFWPPERPFAILWTWATMFSATREFVDRYRPEAQVMVFGHFHRPGVSGRDGRLLINTGGYMRGAFPLVVDLEDGWLRVSRVVRSANGEFRPGAGWGTWRVG